MSREFDPEGAALIAFTGKTDLKALRWLKPGFRHCLIATKRTSSWLICDSLAHQLHIDLIEGVDSIDLEHWFRSRGYRVVRHSIKPAPLRAQFLRPFTCVETVKRMLGIDAKWVFTPWQLYQYLEIGFKK